MAKGLLIIRTLTATHPGAGTSLGAIDLMLQREITTGFPFIQGSCLKGAIRSHLRNENHEVLDRVFGPREAKGGNFTKGSLTISDASLLFYPVRTLKGLYAFVTCPEILRRLKLSHIDLNIPDELLKTPAKDKVKAVNSAIQKYVINNRVYFEDLNFGVDRIGDDKLDWIDALISENSESIKNRFFIVHNDIFQYFTEFATMLISRNRIDYETGTVDKKIGGLWTEEHLPPETYLFSYLEDDGEDPENGKSAVNWISEKFQDSNVIHLGGDETVGKGFVELTFSNLDGNSGGQNG